MDGAIDPTYPLLPVSKFLSAALLLLVLLSSFTRQNWNLGVMFLCFWLFIESIADGVNCIIWSDNAEIKHYVYCDIVTHLQEITFVVKPMATLIITRRLYLIANLQSVQLPDKAARRRNSVIEWILGLALPLLVAGPIYYVNQGVRFQVQEGFGCSDNANLSIVELLTIDSWAVVPPLVSIVHYYPRVIQVFYCQSRNTSSFLRSNETISHTNYLRILILASIDMLLTLPIGIVNIVLKTISAVEASALPLYPGWSSLHSNWGPVAFSYARIKMGGTAGLVQFYFSHWTSPVLAFTIFGLFGLTTEARASYVNATRTVGSWFGWKSSARAQGRRESLGEIEFGAWPQGISALDIETGRSSPQSSFGVDSTVLKHVASGSMLSGIAVHGSDSKFTDQPGPPFSDSRLMLDHCVRFDAPDAAAAE